MPHRVIKSIDGRHGAVLVLAGAMFLPVSISFTFVRSSDRVQVLSWAPFIELWHLGLVFTVASVAGLIIGLWSRYLPPKVVGYGYLAVMIPPTSVAAVFLIAAILGISPAGWITVCYAAGWSALLYLCSGWPNEQPEPPLGTGPLSAPPGES